MKGPVRFKIADGYYFDADKRSVGAETWHGNTARKNRVSGPRYQLDACRFGVIPVIVLNSGCKSLDSIFQGSVVSRWGRFRTFTNGEAFYYLLTSESDSAHDR